jgi:hypothetical protein
VPTIATSVYWDRAEHSVRDWNTGADLPEYQGPCLVYFDLRGPTMMYTFLQAGKRCWKEMPKSTNGSTNVVMRPGQA